MKASAKTIQILQIELAKKFGNRSEKLDFLSQFTGRELLTSKELAELEATDVVTFLKTGRRPVNRWAFFDIKKRQHRYILSILQQAGWTVFDTRKKRYIADMQRLGKWLQSERSPVKKPLITQSNKELSKTIYALENILRFELKKL